MSAETGRPSFRPPDAVRWIVRELEERGFETWAVGGAVRDVLAGYPPGDWDLTTRARPGDVRRIFRRTVPIGIDHGTVGVLTRQGRMYEVTTFRRDVATDGRHAVVEFADDIHDDLARRDFTINAIAWHPLRDEVRDPFGGVGDLRERVLRTVGDPDDRVREDYLRILRAFRFAGRFGLALDDGTRKALKRHVDGLDHLSRERVREELMKVLGEDPAPAPALDLYRTSGALSRIAPEFGDDLPERRPAWDEALRLVGAISRRRPLLRLAALLGTAGLTGDEAAAFMIRLRFSNAAADTVVSLVRAGLEVPEAGDRGGLRRWLSRVGREHAPDLMRVWIARARVESDDDGQRGRVLDVIRAVRAELRSGAPLEVGDLAIGGRDLIAFGLEPGPAFADILSNLLDRVLEDPALNRKQTLLGLVRDEIDLAPEAESGG